jgi:D-alanyl-lipoteichoic acid acyltransferase DltB (MBOAT superfamily)
MLFGTPVFICLFLPAALAGFLLLGRWQGRAAALFFLLLASLVFYAWWKPILVLLLLASIGVNFGVGRVVAGKRRWLVAGLGFNLGLLGFFKYAGFFAGLQGIYLPLGISFFTFQQIMFLVDGRVPPRGVGAVGK